MRFLIKLAIPLCLLLLSLSPAQDTDAQNLVGRLLLLAFEGEAAPLDRLAEFSPAGFLYYRSNVPSTEAARTSTQALQEAADYPLLFGIDQEGGPFNTYRVDDATIFPGNMALAATGDPALAEAVGLAIGTELAYAGFNLNFAPSVDVNSNPDNPIIGVRSFGADVETVSSFGAAYLAGLEASGVAGVAKHFPGHGDTGVDSHLALPEVTGDRTRLNAVELPPFKALIEAGVPGVMTAHVAFPAVEADVPATLSGAALTNLLREELGFDGMVVTDFMDMKAIADNYGPGEAAVRSVVAGADLVLLGADLATQREVYAALQEAVVSGRLSGERVREAVAATEAVASAYRPTWSAAPDYAAHRTLAAEVATRGATLLWNEGALPLLAGETVAVIAPQPSLFGEPPHLGEVLSTYHEGVSVVAVSEDPSADEIAQALAAAEGADKVVLGSYRWLGEFEAGLGSLHDALLATGKPLVVVTLGNPDDLRFLGTDADAYLAVYGFREANLQGAAQVLAGQHVPTGKLPVNAGEQYPLGAGMETF